VRGVSRRSSARWSSRRAPSRAAAYQPHRSPDDPRLFFLYEQYADESGYQAHMDSEHFTRLVKEEAIPHLLESRERAFYVTLD
jgi:quinol monooxygenase YgiN